MAARREKGLCYNCDECYTPTHKCKSRCFLIIADDDDFGDPDTFPISDTDQPTQPDEPQPDPTHKPSPAQISFNAMSGHLAPETLRVTGQVGGQEVVILIDGGSTHNFVQSKVVRYLNLTAQPTKQLSVMVRNGSELTCPKCVKGSKLPYKAILSWLTCTLCPLVALT